MINGGAGSTAPLKLSNSCVSTGFTTSCLQFKKSSTVFSAVRQGLVYPQACHSVQIRGQPAGAGSPLQLWELETGTQVVRPTESSYLPPKFFVNYIRIECALLSSPLNSATLVYVGRHPIGQQGNGNPPQCAQYSNAAEKIGRT